MFSKAEDDDQIVDDKATSVAGIICLVGYMMFDSFTSNYQSGLFKTYQMSKFQMMFGINLFSCFFTLWSLSLVRQPRLQSAAVCAQTAARWCCLQAKHAAGHRLCAVCLPSHSSRRTPSPPQRAARARRMEPQQGQFLPAVDFTFRHPDFMFHTLILSITSVNSSAAPCQPPVDRLSFRPQAPLVAPTRNTALLPAFGHRKCARHTPVSAWVHRQLARFSSSTPFQRTGHWYLPSS